MTYYVHKYKVWLERGGPEEGGWYFTQGEPVTGEPLRSFENERDATGKCWALNQLEKQRAERDERYSFTSVLADECDFYEYTVEDTPVPSEYPVRRPHYE